MHYYPFHIGDFRSGTVNMSRQARWIYRDMMDIYYDTEQPLPLDLDQLFDMLGAESGDEKSIVERHLKFKFEKSDDGYRHEICDKTIAEYHAKAVTARENGKLGGRPKHSKNKPSGFPSGSNPVPNPNPDLTGSEANQEPITNNQEPLESKTLVAVPPTRLDSDDRFARFWKMYPKKQGRAASEKSWQKIKMTDELYETIIQALAIQSQSKDWTKENGQYVPNGSTWLNGKRWEDEVKQSSKSRHNGFSTTDYLAGVELDEFGQATI